ncbi:Hsp20/alpha crystallin family protein [Patiriisocius hiemis]|uniref:Hsp20/alpha crystallin family protein n=1 Tax=Patiriisocius hiemis TaxID=3075604 RepID=A0ABU2YC15_9FLAO|nr:Hsp20/alpha crystallin family protein [Constantimarinum sp. W242]MDT0554578.1 Hsp20/alpha crystallin family protein [Constantimarinum sp. W242]
MKVINSTKNGWFPSIFDDIFMENRLDIPNYEKFSSPAVNISENFTNFIIEVAAPGLEKSDFTIEVEEDVLTIAVTKETEKENDTKFTRKEFDFTNFKRTFSLPESSNKEEIKATYVNGLLTVTIEKVEEPKNIKRMVEIS